MQDAATFRTATEALACTRVDLAVPPRGAGPDGCLRAHDDLAAVLGRWSSLDPVDPPTPRAAAVRAAWVCAARWGAPASRHEHPLGTGIVATSDFDACLDNEYRLNDCVALSIEPR